MQISPSLADFMAKLEQGPQGLDDALAIIDQCAQTSASTLDLQQMQLTDEHLDALLPSLAPLAPHLTTLNLFMNEITILPASLSVLPTLQTLLAGCNPLQRIEPSLLEGLPNLQELDIGFSETLQELPDAFHHLPALRVLLAGNGHLAALPPSLFQCLKLEELQLYGNCLKSISADIANLKHLRIFNVGRNQIEHLPDTIGECKSLQTLHAYENCLSSLPEGAANLDNLVTLNLTANQQLPNTPRQVRIHASAKATAKFYALGASN